MNARHFFHFLVFTGIIVALSPCTDSRNSEVTYIPFKTDEDGKWGMISTEGKVLFENEFRNMPTYVTEDRFFVQNQDGFWQLYAAEETPRRIGKEFRYVSPFSGGVAMATPRNGSIAIIDKDGETVHELVDFENRKVSWASPFVGKNAVVVCDTLYGVVDTKGKTVVPPKYSEIRQLQNGHLIANDYAYSSTHNNYFDSLPKGTQYLLNSKGEEIYKIDGKKIWSIVGNGVTDKYITIKERKMTMKTEKVGKESYQYPEIEWIYSVVDYKGNVVVKPSSDVKQILAIRGENYIFTNEDNLAGVRTIAGEEVIPAEYNGINFIGENYYAVENNGSESNDWKSKVKVIDKEGKQIGNEVGEAVAGSIDYRMLKGEDVFVKLDDDEWCVFDKEGKKVEGVPSIFAVLPMSRGDEMIRTDKVDYQKFLKTLKVTPTSYGEFTFKTRPQKALEIQQKQWDVTTDNKSKPKPSDYTWMQNIFLYPESEGLNYSVEVHYPDALSRQTYKQKQVIDYTYGYYYWYHWENVPTGYVFNDITPSYFKLSFSSWSFYGKLRTLYKAIVKFCKKWGTVEESNSGATLLNIGDGHRLLVAINESEVVMEWGNLPADDTGLWKYNNNSEKLQSSYYGFESDVMMYNGFAWSEDNMEEGGD